MIPERCACCETKMKRREAHANKKIDLQAEYGIRCNKVSMRAKAEFLDKVVSRLMAKDSFYSPWTDNIKIYFAEMVSHELNQLYWNPK